ncbi:MAG: Rid family hydrolase [Rhodanobacteraceae bacterium]
MEKNVQSFGLPWEREYGYVEPIRVRDTIYLAGQVGHDEHGSFEGFTTMEAQMRQAYRNAARLLEAYGASMENVVDEVLFVTDMDSAFAARVACRSEVYGDQALVASTIVEIRRLAFPQLLVEIKFIAMV